MVCTHLRQLYELCQDQQIRLGSSDLVRFVCTQCGEQEVCPSNLMEQGSDPNGENGPDADSDSSSPMEV